MSYLAIGAVTKAIAELLSRKLNKPPLMGTTVPKVTTLPPDDERVSNDDGINLFLYRVSESPFYNNNEWRGDRTNSPTPRRAPLSLTLHYLLTPYAKKGNGTAQDDITAHQLLGNAMAILHEYPVLNDIHDSEFDAGLNTQLTAELRDSYEKIKISLRPTPPEDIFKIWSGLSKAYRLSVFYEVSLVQLALNTLSPTSAAPVQQTKVGVATTGAPLIASVTPSSGPTGAQVSIKGSNLKRQGTPTILSMGDLTLAENELVKVTPEEIVLTMPEALRRGPKVRLGVSVGGRESAPEFYLVQPWINSITPLRGIAGIPLSIPFDAPAGAKLVAQFDGKPVTSTYDVERKLLSFNVPENIATNGAKTVALVLGSGAGAQRSNALVFELLPSVQSVQITPQASPAQTTIEATGQRLDGNDVYLKYGNLLLRVGANTTPTKLSVDIKRVMATDQRVSVIVDGRESNVFPPMLEGVEPQAARRGEVLTLRGVGLSGKSVVVEFGATKIDIGAQPFATQLTVKVPVQLPAGALQLKAVINGTETNALTFEVLA